MKLKHTKVQIVIECIALAALLWLWGDLLVSWHAIPGRIPGHYDFAGNVTRWDGKNSVWLMPAVATALYALLSVITFFPSIWNVPSHSEENKQAVYRGVKTMLIGVKAEFVIASAYVLHCDIRPGPIGAWFLPVMLVAVFGTIIYCVLRTRRLTKQ